jgi:hypothetical protein
VSSGTIDPEDDEIDDEESWMNICKVATKHAAFQPSELKPSSKARVFMPMATRALSRRLKSLSRSAERKILLYQQWFCRLRTAKLKTPDAQAALAGLIVEEYNWWG